MGTTFRQRTIPWNRSLIKVFHKDKPVSEVPPTPINPCTALQSTSSRFRHKVDVRCVRRRGDYQECRKPQGGCVTAIVGVHTITPKIFSDQRGDFLEWFREDRLSTEPDYPFNVAQANCAVSACGVIRGIHFTSVPPGQAKYVFCAAGAIMDVFVDLRIGSPTFGQWDSVTLDDESRKSVYIPAGVGHALMSLSSRSTAVYLCSARYDPASDHAISPLDPELAISWPRDIEPVLSARDAAAPTLAEAHERGLLPMYQACMA